MSKIQTWLSQPNSDYAQGVKLFEENADKNLEYIKFFNAEKDAKPGSMHFQMLAEELKRINAINVRNESKQQKAEAEYTAPEPTANDIVIEKKGTKFIRTKEVTNALLRLTWNLLSEQQKRYFITEEQFEQKKILFAEATELRQYKSALHEKMKASASEDEREELANQITNIESQEFARWTLIDEFKNEGK